MEEVLVSVTMRLAKSGQARQLSFAEIRFPEGTFEDFERMEFENYYTASISVHQINPTDSITLLQRKTLMDCADCEIYSQRKFCFSRNELSQQLSGKIIRIYLFQPSPMWQQFEIRNIKAFVKAPSGKDSKKMQVPGVERISVSQMILADLAILVEAQQRQAAISNQKFGSGDAPSHLQEKKHTKKKKREKKMAALS
jgi:hypothetical protein